jgi:predicted nucleotidyltransferase component of viral defense system
MNQIYIDTARLLVQTAPHLFADGIFALKGGTAINLFLRDMPRLSVDLDLVFPDHRLPRDEALAAISDSLRRSSERLSGMGFQVRTASVTDGNETKLFIRRGKVELKAEVNFVMRGTVNPVRVAALTPRAREVLFADLELPVTSMEDVYSGKLVAAMDRQHPRDLFDVGELFSHEGITPRIRRAFVVYLASHNRPIHEVLFPELRDIRQDYERTFQGMTREPVALNTLLEVRARLVDQIHRELDENERKFLLSLVSNDPQWNLLGIDHLAELPAIRWKLRNLEELKRQNPTKHATQAEELARLL